MVQIKLNGNVVAVVIADLANMFVTSLISSGLTAQNGYALEVAPFKTEQPKEEKEEQE